MQDNIEKTTAKPVHLKATIFRVIDKGQEGKRPWLALAYDNYGAAHIIESDKQLEAEIGDDIHAFGMASKHELKGAASKFVIKDGCEADIRLQEMVIREGADIRSFGPHIEAIERPAAIAAINKLDKHKSWMFQSVADGVTILRHAGLSKDLSLQWGMQLVENIRKTGLTVILDPFAFSPTEFDDVNYWYNTDGTAMALFAIHPEAKEMRGKLAASLPASNSSGSIDFMRADVMYGKPQVMPRGKQKGDWGGLRATVMPYNPFEITTREWQGFTGLNSRMFGVKVNLSPRFRHEFAIAHELAHTVQESFSMPDDYGLVDANIGECFADSFAVLAIAQRDGNLDNLEILCKFREAVIIRGGFSHATGRAFESALDMARKALEDGSIFDMKPEEMLEFAASNARENALDEEMIKELKSARLKIYEWSETYIDPDRSLQDTNGGANFVMAMQKAVADLDAPFPSDEVREFFSKAVKAVEDTAYLPDELDDVDIRNNVAETYRKDLAATIESLPQCKGNIRKLVKMEEVSHAGGGKTIADFEVSWTKNAKGKMLESRREALEKALKKAEDMDILARHGSGIMLQTASVNEFDNGLARLLRKKPKRLLRDYIDLAAKEASYLSKAPKKAIINDSEMVDKANKIRRERENIAFALTSNPKAWEYCKSIGCVELCDQLEKNVSDRNPDYASFKPDKILASKNELEKFVLAAKIFPEMPDILGKKV